MKKFAYIDALRGYAILGVLLVHTSQYCGFGEGAAFGARGVQLFFVASALTLMLSWNERRDGASSFYIRRVFRIVPMFWLSIPLYLGFAAPAYTDQVIAAAAFLQIVRPDWIVAPIVPGGWSVCDEMLFYGLFPLVGLYINSLLRAALVAIICFAVAKWWLTAGTVFGTALFPGYTVAEIATWSFLSLPSQLPAFATGVLCFFLIPHWKEFIGRVATEMLLIGALCYCAYLAACTPANLSAFALAFGVVAICLANGAGRYLINGVVVYIGKLSFSIYLIHWLCIGQALKLINLLPAGGGARFALLFVATTAIGAFWATFCYYGIEQPMIRLGSRVIRMRRAGVPVQAVS